MALCIPKNALHLLGESIQSYRESCENLHIYEGLIDPEDSDLMTTDGHKIIIYDDLFNTIGDSEKMLTMQTFSSRKANISTIIIT